MTRAMQSDTTVEAASLPLVSVVIVNYNYSSWLTEAVESVMAQTYEAIECLIVDDASSDGSPQLIADLQARFPRLRAILHQTNRGSLRASLDGLAATSGPFVHFFDADDLILPTFIEAHVAAHLSMRFPVGFTCCDMILSTNGAAITCCDGNISRYRRAPECKPADRRPLPAHLAARLGALDDSVEIHKVEPWLPRWPWSATSAIVYRRRALQLIAGADGTERIRLSNDTFFAQGVNTIAGSAILDAPLAIYRLHGSNESGAMMPLDHLVAYDKHKLRAKQAATIEVLIAHAITNRKALADQLWDDHTLLDLILRLCRLHPNQPSAWWILRHHSQALSELFGWRSLLRWAIFNR